MAFDSLFLAVTEGGGYLSFVKALPPIVVLALWARLLTWIDKDSPAAHLPRIPLNVAFLVGMAAGYGLFFFLPTFLVAFSVLMFMFVAEAAVYLVLRHQKVGLADLKEQFGAWMASKKSDKKKSDKDVPNQVSIIGKSGSPMAVPATEDPHRAAFDAIQATLTEPLRKGAELITLAPSENGLAVRYQVDGMDYKGQMVERTIGGGVVTLLKAAAGLDINDKRKPQRAMIKLVIDGKRREYRLETAGSTAGEAARFVLEPKQRHNIRLDALGFNARQLDLMRKLIKEDRSGIVLVAAPKTMGMTTTLYGIMRAHDAFLEHLQTVERDPEGEMEGITQNKLPANATPGDEQKAISWAVSQEPDAIMVTRLEDAKSAQDLIRFAKEKRVYVGIRAGSAFDALNQWRKLVGNDKAAVAELQLVIAGRVARKLCMACKVSYAPDPSVVKKLGLNPEKASTLFQARTQPLRDPRGNPVPCDFCLDLRYKGRMGVFETLVIDDDVRQVVTGGGSENQLKAVFRKQRGKYLQEEALGLVESGDTSVQEVLRVLKIGADGGGGGGEPARASSPSPSRPPARSGRPAMGGAT